MAAMRFTLTAVVPIALLANTGAALSMNSDSFLARPSSRTAQVLGTADGGNGTRSEYWSVTESTMTGDDGQVTTRTTTCKNGVCEHHVETRNGTTQRSNEAQSGSAHTQELENDIAAESRRLASVMKERAREFGDIFRTLRFNMHNISSSTAGAPVSSRKSETRIINGQVMQTTTICENGECHTTQTERDLKPQTADTTGSQMRTVGRQYRIQLGDLHRAGSSLPLKSSELLRKPFARMAAESASASAVLYAHSLAATSSWFPSACARTTAGGVANGTTVRQFPTRVPDSPFLCGPTGQHVTSVTLSRFQT